MIASHNYDYSSMITGSSVHNERVERLWRDVNRCVGSVFSNIFQTLERNSMLNPLNETDLYCLHYIFLPRINKCITEFKETWNNHSLSSEGNMSPYQLFTVGLLCAGTDCHNQPHNSIADVDIDSTGEHVSVPRIKFTPCALLLQHIHAINPLQHCLDNGVSLCYPRSRSAFEYAM